MDERWPADCPEGLKFLAADLLSFGFENVQVVRTETGWRVAGDYRAETIAALEEKRCH